MREASVQVDDEQMGWWRKVMKEGETIGQCEEKSGLKVREVSDSVERLESSNKARVDR